MIRKPLQPDGVPVSDQLDRYADLLRVLFLDERGKHSRDGRSFAVVSGHSGAGVTHVATGIQSAMNRVAVQSEVSRMATRITETVNNSPIYGDTSRITSAIRSAVSEHNVCIEPSRLAITIDARQLVEPGAEFGAVVAEGLEPQVLRSRTPSGLDVNTVLDGLTVEWATVSNCRKECLRAVCNIFRLVLIDLPPLKESSEIRRIAPAVDGVIVVVEADKTTTPQLARITETIKSSGGKIVGYVLNKRTYPIPELIYRNLDNMGLT